MQAKSCMLTAVPAVCCSAQSWSSCLVSTMHGGYISSGSGMGACNTTQPAACMPSAMAPSLQLPPPLPSSASCDDFPLQACSLHETLPVMSRFSGTPRQALAAGLGLRVDLVPRPAEVGPSRPGPPNPTHRPWGGSAGAGPAHPLPPGLLLAVLLTLQEAQPQANSSPFL